MGLGLGASPRAGGHGVEGQASQSNAVGKSQRVLLCAGPVERRVPARQALREANLGAGPSPQGTEIWPGVQGGTNWYAPSFSPRTGLFYVTAWMDYHGTYFSWDQEYEQGKWYAGGAVQAATPPTRREPLYKRTPDAGYAAVLALNPLTGDKVWAYPMT